MIWIQPGQQGGPLEGDLWPGDSLLPSLSPSSVPACGLNPRIEPFWLQPLLERVNGCSWLGVGSRPSSRHPALSL